MAFRLSGVRCRRSPGCPTEGTAPISARRVASGRSVLPPGIEVGPIAGDRETGVERTPAETGHLEGPEDCLDRHLRGDLPADDPAPRGVQVRDVGHPFGGVDGGPVRDSDGVRTFRVKDPVNEVRGDVGTTASLSSPLGDLVAPDPGHCHEPGDLVPPDVVAGFLRGDDMSVWILYLRSSPAGRRPGWGSGPRPRSPSRRVPARGLEVGVRVSRACGRWARQRPRCTEAGEGRCERSLRPRRTPRRDIGISFVRRSSRFSLDHGFVRSHSRSPRDRPSSMSASRPSPVRLRPEAELVCHR